MDGQAEIKTPQKGGKQNKRSRPPSSAQKSKRSKKDIWDPVHVMTNQESPLVHADLRVCHVIKTVLDSILIVDRKH